MADTYTNRLGLIGQEEGTHSNEWGDLLNLNFQRLDSATRGYINIVLSGAQTLDSNDIVSTSSVAQEESFFQFIEFTGTGGTVTVPAENIVWTVYNNTGGDFTFQPAGGTGVTLTDGKVQTIIYGSNGTTFTDVSDLMLTGAFISNATLTGPSISNATLTGAATFGTTLNSVTTTEFAMLSGRTLASTDDVIDNFPSGTAMLFYQTAAPTGWTRDTTASLNDHALRIVTSGTWTGGTQGTSAFSTVFGLQATDGHTLIEAEIPAHTHTLKGQQPVEGGSSQSNIMATTGIGFTTGSTGGGGSHAHDIELRVKYLDMILATKD